jgi:hypothetical protein
MTIFLGMMETSSGNLGDNHGSREPADNYCLSFPYTWSGGFKSVLSWAQHWRHLDRLIEIVPRSRLIVSQQVGTFISIEIITDNYCLSFPYTWSGGFKSVLSWAQHWRHLDRLIKIVSRSRLIVSQQVGAFISSRDVYNRLLLRARFCVLHYLLNGFLAITSSVARATHVLQMHKFYDNTTKMQL